MTLNHLVRLEEGILSSLDLPNGSESLHRVLFMDTCAAWHRDALNLEYGICSMMTMMMEIMKMSSTTLFLS